MIDLEKYKPVAHPFRAILRKHKVTNAITAKYLGVSLPFLCNMINGHYPMPKRHEDKLKQLVDQLEGVQ